MDFESLILKSLVRKLRDAKEAASEFHSCVGHCYSEADKLADKRSFRIPISQMVAMSLQFMDGLSGLIRYAEKLDADAAEPAEARHG